MVFTNTVKYLIPDGAYGDETWRSKHGYKEEHQHDAPMRRNRDFKPVPYGAFGGMPNYRRSEPFENLKNIKDIKNEHAHFPTRWFKTFMHGALTGVALGQIWFFVRPINGFAMQKLMAAVGDRPFSGRVGRIFMHTAPPHALIGGSAFLGYQLIIEFLRHHEETNLRPMYIDHMLAMSIIGAIGSASIFGGSPRHMVAGAVFSTITIGIPMYWVKSLGNRPGQMAQQAGVFYQDDCSKDEIDRIVHQDQTEQLAQMMMTKPGFGMIQQDPRFI